MHRDPSRWTPPAHWLALGPIGSAFLIALAGPPFGVPLAQWIALAPLLGALRACGARGAAGSGLLFGALAFGAVFAGAIDYSPGAFAGVIAFGVLFGLLFAFVSWLFLRDARGWVRVLGPPCAWTALEWSCAAGPLAVPVTLGDVAAQSPALALAPLVGVHGISWLLVLASAALLEAARPSRRAPERALAGAVAGAPLALSLAMSWAALPLGAVPHGEAAPFVAIQPAIPFDWTHDSWWRPDLRLAIRARFERELRRSAATPAALVLWPEGGAMLSLFRPDAVRSWLPELFEGERSTLVTASELTETGRRRNRVLAFDASSEPQTYVKQRLVPQAERQYDPGDGSGVLDTRAGRIGVLICYEAAFSDLARARVRAGAELLFVSTNDAALGDSLLPFWHRASARLRAAETGRPVLFVSNRGPSASIDARGAVVAELPFAEAGQLEGAVRPYGGETPYVRFGFLTPAVASAALLLLLLAVALRARANEPTRRQPRGRRLTRRASPAPRSVRGVAGASALAMLAAALLIGGAGFAVGRGGGAPAYAGAGPGDLAAYLQRADNDCGIAALAYLASTVGDPIGQDQIRARVALGPDGASLLALRNAAQALGFQASGREWDYARLEASQYPVIAHLSDLHYVVVLAARGERLLLFDPLHGLRMEERAAFLSHWSRHVLELLPTSAQARAAGGATRPESRTTGGNS